MKLKKILPFYPLLFALFPILFLYSYNIDEVSLIQLLLPCLVTIAGTLILLFALRFKIKDRDKAAIIAIFVLAPFFLYGHIRALIYLMDEEAGWNIAVILGRSQYLLLGIGVILLATGIFYVMRKRRNFYPLTKFMGITAAILMIISVGGIGLHEIQMARTSEELVENTSQLSGVERPDIYYIILDCYERQDTLETRYGYDNSEFIDYLTSKGFYVAPKSKSNYFSTLLSLASSLNMEYLEGVENRRQKDMDTLEKEILTRILQNNKISQDLKSIGYQYIYVSSTWFDMNMEKYADVYTRETRFGNRFTMQLFRTTILVPIIHLVDVPSTRNNILYSFDTIPNLRPYDKPLFVLAHICCPHAPFVFGREGELVEEEEGTYVDQLIFTSKKVKEVIDEILAESEEPPIIVLQSDTGQDSYNILNAYYLPGKETAVFYETISPVNSFRVIFNLYFGTDYELLEDESYGSPYPDFWWEREEYK